MPKELWTEGRDIAQEAVIKIIAKEKKCNKAKWLFDEDLQLAVNRKKEGVLYLYISDMKNFQLELLR